MRAHELLQIALFLGTTLLLAGPLGAWIARVLSGRDHLLSRAFGGIERAAYRVCGIVPEQSMSWRQYAIAVLAFSAVGVVAVFLLLRLQDRLPLDPDGVPAMSGHLAFNTAVSFASNTNWQSYSGEVAASRLSQMLGLAVQNFVSAAAGIAILAALARGITARGARLRSSSACRCSA